MIIQTLPTPIPLRLGLPPHMPAGDPVADPVAAETPADPGRLPSASPMLSSPALQWALAKNNKVADGLNLLSTTAEFATSGSDLAPMVMPVADGLAFSASGVSLAIKLQEGDHWGAAAAGIKLSGTALSLAENYVLPGSTLLTTAAGALKIAGMLVDIAAPERVKAGATGAAPQ